MSCETKTDAVFDIIKCPVCLEIRPDNRILVPCAHTVCLLCIYSMTTKGMAECPQCKESINFPKLKDPLSLPKNFDRNNMAEMALKGSLPSQEELTQAAKQYSEITDTKIVKSIKDFM
jgi:Zinc finger, C3HC4 type (RING finger)